MEIYSKMYEIVRQIPRGKVATYGQIAFLIGKPGAARQVGRAMHDTPTNQDIPCHRVVNHQGRLVPGWSEQRTLLEGEGILFRENGYVDLKQCLW